MQRGRAACYRYCTVIKILFDRLIKVFSSLSQPIFYFIFLFRATLEKTIFSPWKNQNTWKIFIKVREGGITLEKQFLHF